MRAHRAATVLLALASGCGQAEKPTAPREIPVVETVRVRDCEGPATSLPPELAATLPADAGAIGVDALFATLAREVPGGFAGVMYERGRPVLLLTRPEEAAAAKAALEGRVPDFPVAAATVRQARWDFAQLVDWDGYLLRQDIWGPGGIVMSDRDEAANRLRFGVLDEAARGELAGTLEALGLPCDLVLIEIVEPVRVASGD